MEQGISTIVAEENEDDVHNKDVCMVSLYM